MINHKLIIIVIKTLRRSTVPSLPLQIVFPGQGIQKSNCVNQKHNNIQNTYAVTLKTYVYIYDIDNRLQQGILTEGGRLSTVDLLIKIGCFVKRYINIFNIKRSWSKLASTRRSIVLSLPLQWDFPDYSNELKLIFRTPTKERTQPFQATFRRLNPVVEDTLVKPGIYQRGRGVKWPRGWRPGGGRDPGAWVVDYFFQCYSLRQIIIS
jgi:hypothetical protein